MSDIFNQVVICHRPGTKADRYGDPVPDWSTRTSVTIPNVSVQPSSSDEDTDDQQTTVTGWRFYSETGDVDIRSTDRLELVGFGLMFEVVDEPQPWPDPLNGGIDHWEISLQIILPTPVPED